MLRAPALDDAAHRGDCSVRGAAADLYLALWNRTGPQALVVEGDRGVLGLFLDRVHVRWS
jgi:MDMPI C-terminal domain